MTDGHVGVQLVSDRDGHSSSGALPPATDLFEKSSGAMTVPVVDPTRTLTTAPLGGSMEGSAAPTAAALPTMADIDHVDAVDPLAELQVFTVPGRASRPQAVPPRPGVRELPDEVLDTIRRLVAEIRDVRDINGVAIYRGSAFDHDVELDGSELVALGERLGATYGPEVDVIGWFGELDIDDLVDLTAGDVADYVVWCLR
jgi:acyl carrier protein